MAHQLPVARWFGFGFGYSVAEAVALTAAGWYIGPVGVLAVAHVMNITFLLIFCYALVRTMFRLWREHKERRAAPLGTYAKSDSQTGGGGVATAAVGR